MPPLTRKPNPFLMPTLKGDLLKLGLERTTRFLTLNRLPAPELQIIDKEDWDFPHVCAYYRPVKIRICLEYCGHPAGELQGRNWTWPGSDTDREPYGVLAHELGHHVDWYKSEEKGAYFGDYSIKLREESGEKQLTGYCDNDAEWFAEMFRLFVTNHALLRLLRPNTWGLLRQEFEPVTSDDFEIELGSNVPRRILKNLKKKIGINDG